MVGILLISLAAIAIFVLHMRHKRREMAHRERLLALEKGLELPGAANGNGTEHGGPRVYLLRGLIWLFLGIAIAGSLGALFATWTEAEDLEHKLWSAERMRGLYQRAGIPTPDWTPEQVRELQTRRTRQVLPAGAPALGSIPIAVGLAYLLFYAAESRRMRQAVISAETSRQLSRAT